MQARLVSKAPVVITVRSSTASRTITSEWRAVIGRLVFELKEDPRPSEEGGSWRCWQKGSRLLWIMIPMGGRRRRDDGMLPNALNPSPIRRIGT